MHQPRVEPVTTGLVGQCSNQLPEDAYAIFPTAEQAECKQSSELHFENSSQRPHVLHD